MSRRVWRIKCALMRKGDIRVPDQHLRTPTSSLDTHPIRPLRNSKITTPSRIGSGVISEAKGVCLNHDD